MDFDSWPNDKLLAGPSLDLLRAIAATIKYLDTEQFKDRERDSNSAHFLECVKRLLPSVVAEPLPPELSQYTTSRQRALAAEFLFQRLTEQVTSFELQDQTS
ncbi:MAG: hypothetical protein F4149_03585 [Gammaproteobacteria bacterium]|nr:hypothetical protein [Gammaproteobacteria bacterium]